MAQDKPTLITVFDPLCGWCYGFGPIVIQLQEKYAEKLNFDVVSGGMITGSRVGPLANMAAFIRQAYRSVEQYSGIVFGEDFLNNTLTAGTATYSSLEPAKMLTIFRRYFPNRVAHFAHDIQKLIYWNGIDPINHQAYLPLFESYGLTKEMIEPQFKLKEIEQETIREFGKAHRWGITGFPACILQTVDGKAYGISKGYLPFAEMEKKLMPYLS